MYRQPPSSTLQAAGDITLPNYSNCWMVVLWLYRSRPEQASCFQGPYCTLADGDILRAVIRDADKNGYDNWKPHWAW